MNNIVSAYLDNTDLNGVDHGETPFEPIPETEYGTPPEPGPEVFTGRVMTSSRLIVRNYPFTHSSTDTGRRLMKGECIDGRLWAGNNYLWMKVDQSHSQLGDCWVAVRPLHSSVSLIEFTQRDEGAIPWDPRSYATIKHDYESSEFTRPDWGYPVPRSLLKNSTTPPVTPEIVQFHPLLGIGLSEKVQWFWVKQLALSAYGVHMDPTRESFERELNPVQREYIRYAWRSITHGDNPFCKGKGTDKYQDFVSRVNLSMLPPTLWEVSCGGSVHEMGNEPHGKFGFQIKTLKLKEYDQWKDYTYLSHPEYFAIGTLATPYLIGTEDATTTRGPFQVRPLPYLGGKDVPIPLISHLGIVYAKLSRIRIKHGRPTVWPTPYFR